MVAFRLHELMWSDKRTRIVIIGYALVSTLVGLIGFIASIALGQSLLMAAVFSFGLTICTILVGTGLAYLNFRSAERETCERRNVTASVDIR